MPPRAPTHVGLVSDTHGLMRPEALAALAGSDFIVHAGDIGNLDILRQLAAIAPVTAVRGNNDTGPWAVGLQATAVLAVEAASIFVLHDIAELPLDPAATGHHVVVAGHSHRPGMTLRDGVLYINPGSAGPRRFKLPVSVARLAVLDARVTPQLVELSV